MAFPRFLLQNKLVTTPGVSITASSQLASMPASNVLKGGLSTRWRTASGWTFTAANNTLRFNRGGVKTATIAIGTYATGTLAANAVRAALNAADPTPAWTTVHSGGRFTIGNSGGMAFTLEFGTVVATSAHVDLGFASVTTLSQLSHTGGSVAYQSRHTLNVDLGAPVTMTATMVRGHTVTFPGTVYFQADSASLVSVGLDDVTTPDLHVELSAWFNDPLGLTLPGPDPKRYLRLIISDVGNTAGYVEVAVWFVGATSYLTVLPSVQYGKDNEHLSEIVYAEGGAQMRVPRARRRVYRLLFQLEERAGLAVADRIVLDALDALGIGTPFFASFDLPSENNFYVYGFMREGISEGYTVGTYWGIVVNIAEVL